MNAIDTNILVYAFDASDAVRGPAAVEMLDRLDTQDTVLLWQVVCELGAVLEKLRRRGAASLDPSHAIHTVRARFPLVLPDAGVLDLAATLRRDHGVAYWDSLIVAGCVRAGVTCFYTKDRPGLASIGDLVFVNPFQAS